MGDFLFPILSSILICVLLIAGFDIWMKMDK